MVEVESKGTVMSNFEALAEERMIPRNLIGF